MSEDTVVAQSRLHAHVSTLRSVAQLIDHCTDWMRSDLDAVLEDSGPLVAEWARRVSSAAEILQEVADEIEDYRVGRRGAVVVAVGDVP